MKVITLLRVVKLSILDFIRLPWLSLASSVLMGLTLLIIASFLILNSVVKEAASVIRDKVEVIIFLKDEPSEDAVSQFADSIRSRADVRQVDYIDKQKALLQFKDILHDNPEFLSVVTDDRNPLPRSLVVKTSTPEDIANVVHFAESDQFDSLVKRIPIRDLQRYIDRLVQLTKILSTAGLAASVVFITLSVMIIFNTIALAISTRKSEIEIMRLVGATSFYIRTPFVLLGGLYGVMGAAVASIILCIGYRAIAPSVSAYLVGFPIDVMGLIRSSLPNDLVLIGGIGIVLGATISSLAVRRTLRR